MKTNPHYQELKREYIFPVIERKLDELKAQNLSRAVINLGIGDVALPLAPSIVSAVCKAVEEMGQTTKGYAPAEGICSCAKRSPPTNLPASGSAPTRFLSLMEPTAMRRTFKNFFLSTARSASPTPPIRSIWTPISWRGGAIKSSLYPARKKIGLFPSFLRCTATLSISAPRTTRRAWP